PRGRRRDRSGSFPYFETALKGRVDHGFPVVLRGHGSGVRCPDRGLLRGPQQAEPRLTQAAAPARIGPGRGPPRVARGRVSLSARAPAAKRVEAGGPLRGSPTAGGSG